MVVQVGSVPGCWEPIVYRSIMRTAACLEDRRAGKTAAMPAMLARAAGQEYEARTSTRVTQGGTRGAAPPAHHGPRGMSTAHRNGNA